MMKELFFGLAETLCRSLHADEVLTLGFSGEDSDFVRFNHNRVRQAGHVHQAEISLDLIHGQRHVAAQYELQGDLQTDLNVLLPWLNQLRQQRSHLPDDPHLLYATEVNSSESVETGTLPDASVMLDDILGLADGLDLVGILARGKQYHGFANSLGQRNWHERNSFNFDWSCYHDGDKAVKADYAGFDWNRESLAKRFDQLREQLSVMKKPARTISPGYYRAWLAPTALREIIDMMSWGGVGLKSHRTAQTPLIKMVKDGAVLHETVNLSEDSAHGLAPGFTGSGFIKPQQTTLIRDGRYVDCLVGPRSAREFNAAVTGSEYPEALHMAGGSLPDKDVLAALDTGLYINNLWYCNFSDRNDCRITGMTRFACFWVENGQISQPVNVMRFDDSVYRLLGSQLMALGEQTEFLFDSDTYGERSTASYRLPGALIERMRFTL